MPMVPQYVTLKQLAAEIGMCRSHLRRFAISRGFTFDRIRTDDSDGQLSLALTLAEAERLKCLRRDEGFQVNGNDGEVVRCDSIHSGWFYVVQLIPEYNPHRVKLGFTNDFANRIAAHLTSAPTAIALKTWPCKRHWELTVIDALTARNCVKVRSEVFECSDLDSMLDAGDRLFSILNNCDSGIKNDRGSPASESTVTSPFVLAPTQPAQPRVRY